MVHCGVQLASPTERVQFLQDAQLLSSVDLALFFTALHLDPEVRDFWCYQNGPHMHLRTTRMVQGNLESPAIAQAFLEQVLGEVPELRAKVLVYIDNIYLKSVSGNCAAHIRDLGAMARVLRCSEPNTLVLRDYDVSDRARSSVSAGAEDAQHVAGNPHSPEEFAHLQQENARSRQEINHLRAFFATIPMRARPDEQDTFITACQHGGDTTQE
ncbi:hypothetical protein H4R20_000282 [Coemansia guatemalensis]|uniref:Reverse transcriptase domain-containing protein n=1 Tax=Coemansia guatemalensis TaxID=2761395 RepID=A0A9W8I1R2_9FUNG|nr:hypothetical protein H4R20_000282 [Coemansia guatemalensis]